MRTYWHTVIDRRISRRRALAATGAMAAGAAFLAACGGGDDEASGPKDNSGLLSQPVDETKNVKRGGTYIAVQGNSPTTQDPHRIGAHGSLAGRSYSQLFRISDGHLENTSGAPQGDLAESWEVSGDKLQITVKLDPGAGFAPVPPVNSRGLDSDDILFSWERFKSVGNFRAELVNDVSPGAPIVSITAPDKRTVVIKLAEPDSSIFTNLSRSGLGYLWILPREATDPSLLEIRHTTLGSGPYYVSESLETGIRYKRNPNFKRASLKDNEPYIDEIFTPVLVEIATASTQFRTGNVYDYTLPAHEIVSAKRENMDLLMFAVDPPSTERLYFGHNAESPFRDERMRIAFHKTLDRAPYITAAYNTDSFAKEGLPVTEFWEGSFEADSWAGWLLDPTSTKDYGDKQKNFVYDLAESKKLVEAAGHKTPFEWLYNYSAPGPTSFGPPIYRRMEIIENMLEESGVFKMRRRPLEWAPEWTPQIRLAKGNFNGASWGPDTTPQDPAAAAYFVYHPEGGYYEGGDATLTDLALQVRREFDEKRRVELVKEIQRYDAGKMFNQKLGVAGGFRLIWPVVRNAYVHRGGTLWQLLDNSSGSGLKAFIDPSKPPLKKA